MLLAERKERRVAVFNLYCIFDSLICGNSEMKKNVENDDDMQQMWVFALKWLVHFRKYLFKSLILHRQMHMFTISAGIKAYRKTLELE